MVQRLQYGQTEPFLELELEMQDLQKKFTCIQKPRYVASSKILRKKM